MRARSFVALGVLVLVGVGLYSLYDPLHETRRPNVIVYLIDTLRADHVSAYGYERDTTPTIDALAAESIVFENAYAPSSWTHPSVGTLFTGVLPSRHGAKRPDQRLRPDLVTLAGVLRSHGYATHGFTCNPAIDPVFGYDRDFDSYARYGEMKEGSQISLVHDPVEAFLRERAERDDDQPLFLFVHVCAPHEPYAPPAPFDTRFAARDETPAEHQRALYDGEIAYSDAEFGKLLDNLHALGLFDDSVFVLLSDHGEEFGEHGRWLHGRSLFEEVLRVPLVVRLPGAAHGGRRVEARATLADVLPTVLSVVGIAPPDHLDGLDLTASWLGKPLMRRQPLFFELDLRRDRLDALIVDDYKIIDRGSPTAEAGVGLYQLSVHEPDQLVDDPERTAAMQSLLDGVRSELRAGFYVELATPPAFDGVHHVVGRLEILGGSIERFDAPQSEQLRFALADDRTHVDFDLELRTAPTDVTTVLPVGGRVRMRMQIAGEDARMRLSYAVDGEPASRVRTLEGSTFRPRVLDLPLETAIDRADLVLVDNVKQGGRRQDLFALQAPPPEGNPISVHLYRVPDRTAPAIELAPEMRARLRELGYVE